MKHASAASVRLRLTGGQHETLARHLLSGDGYESVALAVCSRGGTVNDEVLVVNEIVVIPNDECIERSAIGVRWPTDRVPPLLARAASRGGALLKIHSHPFGGDAFSPWDDASDRALFPGVYGWFDTSRPHASAIMLPDGRITARVVTPAGEFIAIDHVTVVGREIRSWRAPFHNGNDVVAHGDRLAGADARTEQAFGVATTRLLSHLSVGVIGCSGTGSWVVEMLMRLGIGGLVLVDPDVVETVNLNRIVHATRGDAASGRAKVDVLADAVRIAALGTQVESYQADVFDPAIVRRLARCDVLIGCVDAIDARDLLGRLSTYYTLPYIDVGVRLVADGHGGISHIAGSAQYLQPDGPSLMDRGLYTSKQLSDVGLRRQDPQSYAAQVGSKYISGASESRPAVASVNAFYASLAVNELLQRLHPYRDEATPAGVTISLTQLRVVLTEDGPPPPGLARHIGRGDVAPLLGMPVLSE